jgi:hypothetical protein
MFKNIKIEGPKALSKLNVGLERICTRSFVSKIWILPFYSTRRGYFLRVSVPIFYGYFKILKKIMFELLFYFLRSVIFEGKKMHRQCKIILYCQPITIMFSAISPHLTSFSYS